MSAPKNKVAEDIIMALDKYARAYDKMEYGLPVKAQLADMINIVNTIMSEQALAECKRHEKAVDKLIKLYMNRCTFRCETCPCYENNHCSDKTLRNRVYSKEAV